MRIRLEIPDDKVAAVAAAFAHLTPKLDPEDNGGKVETDAELILRHYQDYTMDQDQVYRMRLATQGQGRDETIVNATDVTP